MIIDARSLPVNETIKTDICVVGAGTAGLTLAREFIDKGFRVSLIESGGLEPDKNTHSLYWGESIGLPYFPLDTARARYFGGSSNRWRVALGNNRFGARMRPLDAIDFEERGWVPHSGWPFGKSELDPYYKRAQSICRIEPLGYDVEHWEDYATTPRLPFISNRVESIIFKFGDRDPFIKDYCEQVVRSDNITAYLNANVIEIETDEIAGTVTHLRLACLQGNSFRLAAKIFILAAGGIETPRLLLLSNKRQGSGLGNQNDLVGRFFMEHLHYWSGVYVPSDPNIFKKTGLYNSIHTVNGVPVIGKLALNAEVLRSEKLINHSVQLIPRVVTNQFLNRFHYKGIPSKGVDSLKELVSTIRRGNIPDNFCRKLGKVVAGLDDISKNIYRRFRKKIGSPLSRKRIKLFVLAHMTEQVPNQNSRVTLGEERDRLGQPRICLNWQVTSMDVLSAIRTQKIIDEELRRARLGRLYIQMQDETPPHHLHGGYHHMGTTRMHFDPQKGVVDENCRVHGISNLYIAGPSVFPTSGYANPVLTIVALSVRLADHIKQKYH